LFILVIKKR